MTTAEIDDVDGHGRTQPDEAGRDRLPSVGVVAVLGIIIVAVAALSLFAWNRNGGSTTDDSAADAIDPASLVTAPPTLVVLDRLPPPPGTPTSSARAGAPAREGSLLEQVVVPTYPAADRPDPLAQSAFDLAVAVSELESDVPRVGSTHLEIGVGGFVSDTTIVRDPVTGRFEVDRDGLVAVVDESSGWTYVDISNPGDERWMTIDAEPLAESVGAADVGTLYRWLMLGPLRPDTIAWATVTPGAFVMIDDGLRVAREYTVVLPAAMIPEWRLYVFGPTSESRRRIYRPASRTACTSTTRARSGGSSASASSAAYRNWSCTSSPRWPTGIRSSSPTRPPSTPSRDTATGSAAGPRSTG